MRAFYLNNFRGFSKILIPLSHVNFLVGENSTGKSSVLKIIKFLSRPEFYLFPELAFRRDNDFGGFSDIVSAVTNDDSYFQVGVIDTKRARGGFEAEFGVFTFKNRADYPYLYRYTWCAHNKIISIIFENKNVKYRVLENESSIKTDNEAAEEFFDTIINRDENEEGFSPFVKTVGKNAPLPFIISIISHFYENPNKKIEISDVLSEGFQAFRGKWIAPIRSKPRRFYEGGRAEFSSEGDHIPGLLRRSLRYRTRSRPLMEKLCQFGVTSGLFETVVAHGFGKSPQAPFELVVRFRGADFNINNVGYGVSQVLPLVVEFIFSEKNMLFAVQQPEVHLHPRAQAALGEFIYEIAKERGHKFILETHSDYMIDRYRLSMSRDSKNNSTVHTACVWFFSRNDGKNIINFIKILPDGKYECSQPKEFRDFFIKEEISLLEL